MQKYIDLVRKERGEPPTIQELSKKFKIDETELMFILESNHKPISIFEGLDSEDGSNQVLLDKLLPGEDESEKLIDKMVLMDAIKNLEKKDRKIIMLRYFRDKTQSEVASILNISQVQVSRMENKIINKLKTKFM